MRPLNEQVADLRRRIDRMLRPGEVDEVDAGRALVRVRYAPEAVTDWLPWLTARAGSERPAGDLANARTWWAPAKGEGVLILAPAGEMAAAVVLPAIYQTGARNLVEGVDGPWGPPEADPAKHFTVYATGATVEHDAALKRFELVTAAGHKVRVDDDGTVTTDGDVVIGGDLTVAGDAAVAGDVSDGTGSMQAMRDTFNAHKHPPSTALPAPRME